MTVIPSETAKQKPETINRMASEVIIKYRQVRPDRQEQPEQNYQARRVNMTR